MKAEAKFGLFDRLQIAGQLMVRSFREMRKNDPLRMAGATAFFTTFALPPILILLFQLFSLFLSKKIVGSQMREILTRTLGDGGANAIRETTRGFRALATTWYLGVIGIIFLLFVATTLFSVIKNTFNDIWKIQPREKRSILSKLKLRGRSILVILVAGALFLIGIFLDSVEAVSGNYLDKIWPGGGQYFKGAMNEIVSAIIVTSWFIVLFRFLADARPTWKVSVVGGLLTGILFSLGKAILNYLLVKSNIGVIYGPSGSIVLILLFVFYSSFILYYGACFIKVYAEELHQPIRPVHKAYRYQLRKIT